MRATPRSHTAGSVQWRLGSRVAPDSRSAMLAPLSLLLAAVCLCSRAATLESGGPEEDATPAALDGAISPSDSLTGGEPSGLRLADTWTEAAHLRTEDVSVLPSGTEATMSSEDLPLIFEPFEDATPAAEQKPKARAAATEPHPPDQQRDGVSRSSAPDLESKGDGVARSSAPDLESKGDGVARSSAPDLESKGDGVARSSAPDLESKEEPEEDEEDEEMDSEEEEEEESEEDLMESTMAPHTRPPYSLIPPPPVWVQRNQGLVRSWVELIREKVEPVLMSRQWNIITVENSCGLCVGDAGARGHWDRWGSPAGGRSVQHQTDPSQEERQLQTPEEEAAQRGAERAG